jgi:antitoxin FitA
LISGLTLVAALLSTAKQSSRTGVKHRLLTAMLDSLDARHSPADEALVAQFAGMLRAGPAPSVTKRLAVAPFWRQHRYNGAVATIQIKNVSHAAHAVLRQRAAAAGQSLQEYMLAWVERAAARPTVDEVLERISHRSGGQLSTAEVVAQLREERDRR